MQRKSARREDEEEGEEREATTMIQVQVVRKNSFESESNGDAFN
jgi:hypothetical protein